MKPSELVKNKRSQILALTQRFHLINPQIFGSVVNGTDTEQSDLDILVEPLPQTTMFDICGLQVELETLLGIKVDVLTPRSLPEKFRRQVLLEAKPL